MIHETQLTQAHTPHSHAVADLDTLRHDTQGRSAPQRAAELAVSAAGYAARPSLASGALA
jgi:hypothetical protein